MDTAQQDTQPGEQLSGGELLTAISNRVVSIMRTHYGRGPTKAKTYVLDDLVVVVLRNGFTAIEQTLVDKGESDEVVDRRRDFQRLMAEEYKQAVLEMTGRNVVAFMSQAHLEPDLTLEIFFLDGPLPGFGTLEMLTPGEDGVHGEEVPQGE